MARHECLCIVCGRDFEHIAGRGQHVAKTKVCPTCAEWHAWCGFCKMAHLRSEFPRRNPNRCSRPAITRYVAVCARCEDEWIDTRAASRVKTREPLCDRCFTEYAKCSTCGQIFPHEAFLRRSDAANRTVTSSCRKCISGKYKKLDAMEKIKRKVSRYGLSTAEYQAMVIACDNRCHICGERETLQQDGSVRELAVDHCHTTGEVRGLLCCACNQALGLFEDDPERLEAAADYVEQHAAQPRLFTA